MITFLPSSNYRECARVLDHWRLRSQINEASIILKRNCYDPPYPRVQWTMWNGYEMQLARYIARMDWEWQLRGHTTKWTLVVESTQILSLHLDRPEWWVREMLEWKDDQFNEAFPQPWWLGNDALHASHRSNLLMKKPEHYSQFGWTDVPAEKLRYLWPRLDGTIR